MWCTFTLDDNGGSGGAPSTFYAWYGVKQVGSTITSKIEFFSTAMTMDRSYRITELTTPTKPGFAFSAYKSTDASRYFVTSGYLSTGVYIGYHLGSSMALVAEWKVGQRVYIEGADADPFYCKIGVGGFYSDADCTQPIAGITPPAKPNYDFLGCFGNPQYTNKCINVDGTFTPLALSIIPTGVGRAAFYAQFEAQSGFGMVYDWFGLTSGTLVPESSSSGDNKQHVCVYNATGETPASDTASKVWRNPTVTYRVVGDMTLSVTLGRAFAATADATGYMITSVTVETAMGEPPTVTVTAVANEGANAIQTYPVNIPVIRRHRAQNLLSAFTNGDNFLSLRLVASCDPVVLAENNLPCASDVVHGHVEISATQGIYDDAAVPSTSAGFTVVGSPESNSGTGYRSRTINLRKELI